MSNYVTVSQLPLSLSLSHTHTHTLLHTHTLSLSLPLPHTRTCTLFLLSLLDTHTHTSLKHTLKPHARTPLPTHTPNMYTHRLRRKFAFPLSTCLMEAFSIRKRICYYYLGQSWRRRSLLRNPKLIASPTCWHQAVRRWGNTGSMSLAGSRNTDAFKCQKFKTEYFPRNSSYFSIIRHEKHEISWAHEVSTAYQSYK